MTLAFGDLAENGPRRYTDVTTFAKRRAFDPGLGQEPVSLNHVCEKAQFVLVERVAAYAGPDERRVARELLERLPWARNAPSGFVPDGFRPTTDLTVDGRQVPAFAATDTLGWALCADLGDVLVTVTGDRDRSGPVALNQVVDLGPYPAATTDSDHDA